MLRGTERLERRLEAIFKAPARAKAREKRISMKHISECRAARLDRGQSFQHRDKRLNARGITTMRFLLSWARRDFYLNAESAFCAVLMTHSLFQAVHS